MTANAFYPIGIAGQPWGKRERDEWRSRQQRRRSYEEDVVARITALQHRFEKIGYGQIDCGEEAYTLHALRSGPIDPALPTALITGGVHGYETSGVLGALEFIEQHAGRYAGRVNLLVVPCVSPWAYERVNRWNYDAIDPNRNFRLGGPSQEAAALIALVERMSDRYLLHIDLHETTDSDESEFRPALSARDGNEFEAEAIPEGFYLVADAADPQLALQQTIIAKVREVTRIAEPDSEGRIIGSPIIAHGVIAYPVAELGLCASITKARFTSTTEVYPDAPDTTAELCRKAQIAAICAALDFALRSHR